MSYWLLTWLLAPLVWLRLKLVPTPRQPSRILLIQTAKIGDFLCSTSLIAALRRQYPEAYLAVLVSPLTAPLATNVPGVDEVLPLPANQIKGFKGRWQLYRQLRRSNFDTSICISPNQSFLLLTFLAGITRRATLLPNYSGASYRRAAVFQTHCETHQAGRMLVESGMALLQQLGVNGTLPAKTINPAPGAEARIQPLLPNPKQGDWIGIGVSSGNKMKELGKEKLQQLCEGLLARPNICLFLLGGPSDQTLADQLQQALPTTLNNRVYNICGKVALPDLAALMDVLDAYLGVDSGLSYLADARNIPVLNIMGPANPEDQRPTGLHALIWSTELSCAPCSHAFKAPYTCATGGRECVQQLPLTKLLNTANAWLDTLRDK